MSSVLPEGLTPFRSGGEIPSPPFALGLAASPTVKLADVSEFQPNVADATYLAWSKAIVVRALYGTSHDDNAWYNGERRDLLHSGGATFVGIYQYLVSGQSGVAAANAFHALVGSIRKGEVFIADFEEGSKSELVAWYNQMIKLYGAEIAPYLWTYSGLDFGLNAGLAPWQWLADYSSVEPGSPKHVLWQFTSDFDVPGVGIADCSLFHGTIAELSALAFDGVVPPVSTAFTGEYVTAGLFDLANLATKLGYPVNTLLRMTAVHYGTFGNVLGAYLESVLTGNTPVTAPIPAGVLFWCDGE
jgi:hypothetical protein